MSETLRSTFRAGDHVIELGCGTGDEALMLGAHGCTVFALDPSSEMIRLATRKAAVDGMTENVRFFVGSGKDLANQLTLPGGSGIDGAYASFSLSYEPDLGLVAGQLAPLIKPGGRFIIAFMNKICAVELLAAALLGNFRLAGRRLDTRTLHKVGEYSTLVFPRTTKSVVDALAPHFVLEKVRALPAVLPPHYANRALRRWPTVLDVLSAVDPYLGSLPIIRSLGDHILVRLRRKG